MTKYQLKCEIEREKERSREILNVKLPHDVNKAIERTRSNIAGLIRDYPENGLPRILDVAIRLVIARTKRGYYDEKNVWNRTDLENDKILDDLSDEINKTNRRYP